MTREEKIKKLKSFKKMVLKYKDIIDTYADGCGRVSDFDGEYKCDGLSCESADCYVLRIDKDIETLIHPDES